jgi:RNA 3'-terminal phosphate cyclase
MALGSGGYFTTSAVSPHLRSNAAVIERFTGKTVTITPEADRTRISVN